MAIKKGINADRITNNIFIFSGDEEEKTPYDWDSMPEFVQEQGTCYAVIDVNVYNQDDLDILAKILEQSNVAVPSKIGKMGRSVWFPKHDINEVSGLFWVEEK